MNIGENIKKIRELRGLTSLELSKRVGIPHRTLQQYENNSKVPKLDALMGIAEELHTSLDSLVGKEEKQNIPIPFTVEEFRVITDVLCKLAENDNLFNTYNYLYDKAEDTLRYMEQQKRLHRFDYDPIPRDIESGNFFTQRRDRFGISREELAEACGVTSNVVCDWESGTKKPTRNHIPVLRKRLKLTKDEVRHYIDSRYV